MGADIILAPLEESTKTFDYKVIDCFSERYLKTYYQQIDPDELEIAKFLVREYKKIRGKPSMLELGCGPTIHHVLPAVPYVSRIEMADYLPSNISHIQSWITGENDSHNWHHFSKVILKLEKKDASMESVKRRENDLRKLIKALGLCDVLRKQPLEVHKQFSVVGFFYCAEEVAIHKKEWRRVMLRVSKLVKEGGYLFMAALRGTHYYTIIHDDGFHENLPTAYILEDDIIKVLNEANFDMKKTVIEVAYTPMQKSHGVRGVILVSGKKKLRSH